MLANLLELEHERLPSLWWILFEKIDPLQDDLSTGHLGQGQPQG